MKTIGIVRSSLFSSCLLIVLFAKSQQFHFVSNAGGKISTGEAPYTVSGGIRSFSGTTYAGKQTSENSGNLYHALLQATDDTTLSTFPVLYSGDAYTVDSWESQNNISNFNGNGLRITSTGNAYSQDAITYQSGLNGGGAGIAFGRGPSWDTFMGFYTNHINNGGTGNIIERMRLDHDGNLGIGTIHPHEKLTVNGTIVARRIKVSVSEDNYADYVFAPAYRLRSLTSVATFIKKYRHLPEVPSARKVGQAGLDVGASQVILLKKIEELTLYVLQLHTDINRLKKQYGAHRVSKN